MMFDVFQKIGDSAVTFSQKDLDDSANEKPGFKLGRGHFPEPLVRFASNRTVVGDHRESDDRWLSMADEALRQSSPRGELLRVSRVILRVAAASTRGLRPSKVFVVRKLRDCSRPRPSVVS